MKIPLIDGHLKGEVIEGDEKTHTFATVRMPEITVEVLTREFDPYAEIAETVYYYVHLVSMFGHAVRFASIHPLVSDIYPDDLWDTLVSEKAKAAECPR